MLPNKYTGHQNIFLEFISNTVVAITSSSIQLSASASEILSWVDLLLPPQWGGGAVPPATWRRPCWTRVLATPHTRDTRDPGPWRPPGPAPGLNLLPDGGLELGQHLVQGGGQGLVAGHQQPRQPPPPPAGPPQPLLVCLCWNVSVTSI